MPLPKGKAGSAKGGGAASGSAAGTDACGLCGEAIDYDEALGFIKGTCSTCGVRPYHFECVADHVERNAKISNSSSKCKEKGKNIARTRPQDLFAQNRTVQRKPQKCTQADCNGTMVDAELVKPQRQQAPAPEAAAPPQPAAKPVATPAKAAKQPPQQQKAAAPARSLSDGSGAAAAAAKQQQLRAAAAAARASLAPASSGSSSHLGTGSSSGWRAAGNAYDREEPLEAEPPADVTFDRQAAAAAASRLSFPRGKRPKQLQMCPKWKAGEQCLKLALGECPLAHGVEELVAREAEWDAAHGGGRLQAPAPAAPAAPASEGSAAPAWGAPEPPAWGEAPAEPAAPAAPAAAGGQLGGWAPWGGQAADLAALPAAEPAGAAGAAQASLYAEPAEAAVDEGEAFAAGLAAALRAQQEQLARQWAQQGAAQAWAQQAAAAQQAAPAPATQQQAEEPPSPWQHSPQDGSSAQAEAAAPAAAWQALPAPPPLKQPPPPAMGTSDETEVEELLALLGIA